MMIPEPGDIKSVVEVQFDMLQQRLPKERKWKKTYSKEVEKIYLYLCDNAGYVKVWNLTEMIEAHKIEQVPSYIDTVLNYYPSRSERINLTSTAHFARKDAKVQNNFSLELDPFFSGVLLREAQSNIDAVTSINLSEVSGLITCCPKEQEVTIWDPFTLNVWGVINLNSQTRDLKWAYPVAAIE